jgi:biopolymer transport protein ExbD
MDFSPPPRRRRTENLLPMVNVVFLLLIFFLISAKLAPPEPFSVTLPRAEAETAEAGAFTLYLSAEGTLGFLDVSGNEAARAALSAALAEFCDLGDCVGKPPALVLRADAAAPAAGLAALLPQLAGLGFARVQLVTALP